MDICYVNHNNEKIDLMSEIYNIEESSFFSHSWGYDARSDPHGYGGEITKFKKDIQNKKIAIHINSYGIKTCEQSVDQLMKLFEIDILEKIPGILYIDDQYLKCYMINGSPKYFVPGIGSVTYEFELIAENSFWITEKTFSFQSSDGFNQGVDFSFDFPFDFAGATKGSATLNNDHYAASDFKMTIYGPVMNLQITISGYTYSVNTTVEENEYLVIDSREGTVIRVQQDGTQINEFDNRSTAEKGVFRKIPAGNLNVNWSGDFGFDITLYQERSEPKWS